MVLLDYYFWLLYPPLTTLGLQYLLLVWFWIEIHEYTLTLTLLYGRKVYCIACHKKVTGLNSVYSLKPVCEGVEHQTLVVSQLGVSMVKVHCCIFATHILYIQKQTVKLSTFLEYHISVKPKQLLAYKLCWQSFLWIIGHHGTLCPLYISIDLKGGNYKIMAHRRFPHILFS